MWTSFSVSPSSIRWTGMPVHFATTSATSSAVTSSLRKPSSESVVGARFGLRQLPLEPRELAVAQLGGALQVGLALGALGFRDARCRASP